MQPVKPLYGCSCFFDIAQETNPVENPSVVGEGDKQVVQDPDCID